jgi:hypothetical protein
VESTEPRRRTPEPGGAGGDTPGEGKVLTFRSAEEQETWTLAEALSAKGFAAMRQAEEAAENFRVGKMATRRQFKQRGLTDADADIRWAGTTQARKALADNQWYMAQAQMYHDAAAAQYAKALYLSRTDHR